MIQLIPSVQKIQFVKRVLVSAQKCPRSGAVHTIRML